MGTVGLEALAFAPGNQEAEMPAGTATRKAGLPISMPPKKSTYRRAADPDRKSPLPESLSV